MAKKSQEKPEEQENSTLPSLLTRDDIPTFLKKVDDKIKEIKIGMPEQPSTKGITLKGYGEISTMTSVSLLIKAHASVTFRAERYKASKEELGIDTKKYPFEIQNQPLSAWVSDIKARIQYLTHKDELTKLEKIKKTLEENLSQEHKLQRDLEKIKGILEE